VIRSAPGIQDIDARLTHCDHATRSKCCGFVALANYTPDPGLLYGPFVLGAAAGGALVAMDGATVGVALVAAGVSVGAAFF
jgi:hypothetical protein